PSSTMTVKMAIERAIEEAAPEVARVEVENLTREREPQLLQIRTMRPEWQEPCPAGETGASAGPPACGASWGPSPRAPARRCRGRPVRNPRRHRGGGGGWRPGRWGAGRATCH